MRREKEMYTKSDSTARGYQDLTLRRILKLAHQGAAPSRNGVRYLRLPVTTTTSVKNTIR